MSKRVEVVYEQDLVNPMKVIGGSTRGVKDLWSSEGGGIRPLLVGQGHVMVTEEERQW